MKFYDSIGPNPKLVRMFAAEKGYTSTRSKKVDLIAGANRKEPYLSKNPAGQLPCLELDDGRVIAETIAICELIEELQPEPALIGTTPERARRDAHVGAPDRVEDHAAAGRRLPLRGGPAALQGPASTPIPRRPPGLKAIAQDGLAWLDGQLAGRDTIVPGRFTLADIPLFAFLEFGATVGQTLDGSLQNLSAWFEKTKARPSAKA